MVMVNDDSTDGDAGNIFCYKLLFKEMFAAHSMQ